MAGPSTTCQQTPPLLVAGCVTVQRDVAMPAGHRTAQADAEFDLATSFDLPAQSHEIETQPADSASKPPRKGKRRKLVLDICVALGVAVVYLLSRFGYHWLATAPGQLADPDLSTEDNSVVLVRIE